MRSITKYVQIPAGDVPGDLVWIAETASRGHIVHADYSTGIPAGRQVNYDAADGDPWMRVTDDSDRSVTYYRLAK